MLDQRYRVLRQVGRDGAGIGYEAEHEAMARRVAGKVLAISLYHDDPAFQSRLASVWEKHQACEIAPRDGEAVRLALTP